MNTFWKSFFATLLAMVVFSLMMFFILLGMVAAISASMEKKTVAIEPHSVLYLDLNYPIREQTSLHVPFPSGSIFSSDMGAGLNDILRAIEAAENDPQIDAILLQMGYNVNPYATLQEIRNALRAFRVNSDKPVIAYGEVVNQSSYYLGSVADEVYLNPAGVLEFKGLAARLTFIKGTLDKLGIRTQVFWAGEYKSATEPLRLDRMSDRNREQLREYVGGLYDLLLDDISVSRKFSPDSLKTIANELHAWLPTQTVSSGLVDSLLYEDQLMDLMRDRLETGEEQVRKVTVSDYVTTIAKQSGNWENQIAVVYMQGDIVDGNGQDGSIGSSTYRKILTDIRMNDEIKAVVIRVNSGGGSSVASEVLWREVVALQEVKPVVVSMGDYAASGGYMIACGADKIFAQPNTLTGSIGVFMILPDISRFREEKLGMTTDTLLTGKHADFPTISRPVTVEEAVKLQEGVDLAYLNFKRTVADGRHLDMEAVEQIAKGHIWLGTTAQQIGLVDELGSREDAIEAAAALAEMETWRIHEYPEQKSALWEELLFNLTREQMEAAQWQEKLGELFEPYMQVQDYLEHPVIRAELPYQVEMY